MKQDGQSGVTRFRKRAGKEELERLKRLTGLDFDSVPESLVAPRILPFTGNFAEPDALQTEALPVRPARH